MFLVLGRDRTRTIRFHSLHDRADTSNDQKGLQALALRVVSCLAACLFLCGLLSHLL